MKDQTTLDLLQEIIRLAKKYGPDAFIDLAARLEDPETTRKMVAALEGMAELSRSTKTLPAKPVRSDKPYECLKERMLECSRDNPEKAGFFRKLFESWETNRSFWTLHKIRSLGQIIGTTIPEKAGRMDAFLALLENLDGIPLDKLKGLAVVPQRTGGNGGSLQDWADIIIKKPRKNGDADATNGH